MSGAIPAHHLSRITCLIQPCPGRVTDALFISWSRLAGPLPQHPDQDTTFGIHHCDVDLIFALWLLDEQKQQVLSRLKVLEDTVWLRGIEDSGRWPVRAVGTLGRSRMGQRARTRDPSQHRLDSIRRRAGFGQSYVCSCDMLFRRKAF